VWGKKVEPAAPVQSEEDKKKEQLLRWGLPALALMIGVIAGGAITEPDVEASPAYLSLQSELTSSQQEANALAGGAADAEARIRQADEREALLVQRTAELDGRSAQLDQREQELVAREAAAAEAPQAVTRPAPVAAVPAAPEAPAASSTYYENCAAVRAAGAAPIHAGEPGYGKHLDREGDGIGCE
jgi:colicin import membrane protein